MIKYEAYTKAGPSSNSCGTESHGDAVVAITLDILGDEIHFFKLAPDDSFSKAISMIS